MAHGGSRTGQTGNEVYAGNGIRATAHVTVTHTHRTRTHRTPTLFLSRRGVARSVTGRSGLFRLAPITNGRAATVRLRHEANKRAGRRTTLAGTATPNPIHGHGGRTEIRTVRTDGVSSSGVGTVTGTAGVESGKPVILVETVSVGASTATSALVLKI